MTHCEVSCIYYLYDDFGEQIGCIPNECLDEIKSFFAENEILCLSLEDSLAGNITWEEYNEAIKNFIEKNIVSDLIYIEKIKKS